MINVSIILLLVWLFLSNVFKFNVRFQGLITLNIMSVVFIVNLNYLFYKSNVFMYFENVFLDLNAVIININSNFFMFNNAFYIDNVSNLFIILTTMLTPFALLTNWNSIVIFNSKRLFFTLLIWIEIMLIITFSTVDLFVFYLGFEGLSIPVFFLIYLYGAEVTKIRASLYFIVYSFLSSTFMAISIFLLYTQFGTSNINQILYKYSNNVNTLIKEGILNYMSFNRVCILWMLLFLSFIIKLPMVPFHMWLPEAHAEAPTSGSILLTGVILKLGGYGLYRFFVPLFGNFYYFTPLIHTLSIVGIIYIGLTCLRVNHIKQIIAYSSIIHMNAVCLGLFTNKVISFTGAIYAMLSHSLISSCMFMLAGTLYNRYESYYIEDYSGLSYNMPYFSLFLGFMLFANIATPLTSGFIAELFILIDLSKYNMFIFLIFFTNYMLNTGYSIWLFNRLVFGDSKLNNNNFKKWVNFSDLNLLEVGLLVLFTSLIVYFGIVPNSII